MSISEKLSAVWFSKDGGDSVFMFKTEAQRIYEEIQQSIDMIQAILARTSLNAIDAEIKQAGAGIRSALVAARNSLDAYKEFLEWSP